MGDWLIVCAYLAVAVVAWLHIYRWLYRHHRRHFGMLEWTDGDRMFGLLWGGAVALGWPFAAAVFGAVWLFRRFGLGPIRGVFQRIEDRAEVPS
jgi:hypothetical protein